MKIVSWNVNGLRACWEKGLEDFIKTCGADILCLQETKTQSVFPPAESMGYYAYWSFSERPKYSGTLCLSKHKPIQVHYGIGNEEFDREGRVITLSFGQFYLVNCYVPNSQSGVNRACFRMDWDVAFRDYLCRLNEMKPVIVVGDFNVARSYIIFPLGEIFF